MAFKHTGCDLQTDSSLAAAKHLVLPLHNDATTPTLSFGDGDSGFFEYSDDTIMMSVSGSAIWEFTSGFLRCGNSAKAGISSVLPSATAPNIHPATVDADTGIGTAGADILSFIAGGVEAHRMTEVAGAIVNSFIGIAVTSTTQTLTGAGAVDIVSAITHVVSTGANALTLADGVEGQHKYIVMKTDAGDATLTPTNPGNFATIVFNDVGDSAQLLFTNGKWHYFGGTATLT